MFLMALELLLGQSNSFLFPFIVNENISDSSQFVSGVETLTSQTAIQIAMMWNQFF